MSGRMRIGGALRTAAAVMATMACIPAAAWADAEPNNSVFAPEGPIAGGQEISGTVSFEDPSDWYVLYVEGVHQLHLTATPAPGWGCPNVELTDANGHPIPPDYTSPPGTTRFFVHVSFPGRIDPCKPEVPYSFRVDPVNALVDGPGALPIRGTAEPNERPKEASGPLQPGGWYVTRLETVNDEDWLHFYVRPGRRRVIIETATYHDRYCGGHQLALIDYAGVHIDFFRAYEGEIASLTETVRGGAKLFVRSTSSNAPACVGQTTVVQVGPDDVIMSPRDVRAACAGGRRASKRWLKRVRRDRRAIARREGRAPRRLRRKLKLDRRRVRIARRRAAVYC